MQHTSTGEITEATDDAQIEGARCGAPKDRVYSFWEGYREARAEAARTITDADRARHPVNQVTQAMHAAINELPEAVRAAQHFKLAHMLVTAPALFAFIGDVRCPTSGTVQDEGGLLYPTQGYMNAMTAVRAGKLDWEVELAGKLHPVELRKVMPWWPRWPKHEYPRH